MITETTKIKVKNRSSSICIYKIPETNVRREFQPGEIKSVPFGELEKLTYQQGGRELLEHFLQIVEEPVTNTLSLHREPEYDLSEEQIKALIQRGSLDQFLDALDFAPIGVVDLIKSLSVSVPLVDLNKRKALLEKTGFDVDKAIMNSVEEKATDKAVNAAAPTTTGRRTNVSYKAPEAPAPVVETEPEVEPEVEVEAEVKPVVTSKYKVVTKAE